MAEVVVEGAKSFHFEEKKVLQLSSCPFLLARSRDRLANHHPLPFPLL